MDAALLDYLSRFVTNNKLGKFEEVLELRTRYLTVVLEDIYQSQNTSAILRSCECFGIQDVHIIENENKFKLNPKIVMGGVKWLHLHRHNKNKDNSAACFKHLKDRGYHLVAATPGPGAKMPDEVPLDKKIALVFGTEITGLSKAAMQAADDFVKIPMFGFTESFNVSVSAALLLSEIGSRIRKSSYKWHLTEEEKNALRLEWVKKSIKRADVLEKEFLKNRVQ